jgi:hypothetical protein
MLDTETQFVIMYVKEGRPMNLFSIHETALLTMNA